MKHYTIILNRPEGALRERFPAIKLENLYNTNQVLVWDGPCRKKDAVKLFNAVCFYARGASLTEGRDAGRHVMGVGSWD